MSENESVECVRNRPSFTRWMLAIIAGLLAFCAAFALGVLITIAIVHGIAPLVSSPGENWAGLWDGIVARSVLYSAACIALSAAIFVGLAVAIHVAYWGHKDDSA